MNIITKFYCNKSLPNFVIFGFDSEEFSKRVDTVIEHLSKQYEDKVALIKRTDKEIFLKDKQKSVEKKMREFFFGKKATMDELIDHYYNHIHKVQGVKVKDEGIEEIIGSLKAKFFSHISKYTNDFVEPILKSKMTMNFYPHNLSGESSLKKPTKDIKKSATQINKFSDNYNEVKRPSEDIIIVKPETATYTYKDESLDNSYVSNPEVKIENEKKRKDKNYFGYNEMKGEETQDSLRRLNDLYKLELNFFKQRDKSSKVNNQEFSEIYYRFKKQL